jgi:hypothetical protein
MEAKEVLKQMLGTELDWMALHAVSSDKSRVKDSLVKSILMSFSRKGFIPKYGAGGIQYNELLEKLKQTNLYKWVEVIDATTSREEMIALIQNQYSTDQPFVSKTLTKTWGDITSMFGIHWKPQFEIPKDIKNQPLLRKRTLKPRQAKIAPEPQPQPKAEPQKHWLENVPEDSRHIVQMLSEVGSTSFQREIIKTILTNRFNEELVSHITFQVTAQNNGHRYEFSVKKL